MRIADRHFGYRQPLRMRAEHHRSRLGRAVGIGHGGVRQRALQRVIKLWLTGAEPMRTNCDARQIGLRQKLGFAQHHGDHRRHRGQPGAAIALDRLDIGAAR